MLNHPRFAKYKRFIEHVEVNGDKLTLKLKQGQDIDSNSHFN
jgi:hypothetical protein